MGCAAELLTFVGYLGRVNFPLHDLFTTYYIVRLPVESGVRQSNCECQALGFRNTFVIAHS